jgi:L-fucose isomerase
MKMAEKAAQLISSQLRHPNGLPVECVIADTTIGGAAEAAKCADKFSRADVGVSLSVTPCWCYGMETIDMDPYLPKAIWGFNGTERPGAVYLAAALAGHGQLGLPAFGIYGREVMDVQEENIPEDVRRKSYSLLKRFSSGSYERKVLPFFGQCFYGYCWFGGKPRIFQRLSGNAH